MKFTPQDADRVLGLANQFLEDWKTHEGKDDPECAEMCTKLGEATNRIPACVKACDGIATEELNWIAQTGGMIGPRADIARMAKQRDDLLSALGLIEVDKDGDGFICCEAMEQVRDAMASAEGG